MPLSGLGAMTDQPAFVDLEYGQKKPMTRWEEFLAKLERLVPWQRLEERIGPQYFRGERGRRPIRCCWCISSNCATTSVTRP